MLSFLPAPIMGAIAGILFLINILIVASLVIVFGSLQYLMPFSSWRKKFADLAHDVVYVWTDINNFILKLSSKTKWSITSSGVIDKNHWYFVFSNHQTWADIIVMQKVFNRKIPLLKFFLKKELLWSLPMGGVACWMLDYPFMQRHSKAYLKKHPEKKNQDLETTDKACEKFKQRPTAIINFLEGTRFTEQKRQDRSSPYKHLLRPKAGGVAYVVEKMKGYIDSIIDVTVVYSTPEPTFWKLLTGQIQKIHVHYDVIPLTPELYGEYYNDPEFRRSFQRFINTVWQEKDKLIDSIEKA